MSVTDAINDPVLGLLGDIEDMARAIGHGYSRGTVPLSDLYIDATALEEAASKLVATQFRTYEKRGREMSKKRLPDGKESCDLVAAAVASLGWRMVAVQGDGDRSASIQMSENAARTWRKMTETDHASLRLSLRKLMAEQGFGTAPFMDMWMVYVATLPVVHPEYVWEWQRARWREEADRRRRKESSC